MERSSALHLKRGWVGGECVCEAQGARAPSPERLSTATYPGECSPFGFCPKARLT